MDIPGNLKKDLSKHDKSVVAATASAPCRIDLFGNWSDDLRLLSCQPSRIVSCAISFSTFVFPVSVSISLSPYAGIYYRSKDIDIDNLLTYMYSRDNPVISTILSTLGINDENTFCHQSNLTPGLFIISQSDVPYRSGLGCSSALCVCGYIAALCFAKRTSSLSDIAESVFILENRIHQVGWQDHYASAYGGLNLISRKKNDTHAIIRPLSKRVSDLLRIHSLIVFVDCAPHGPIPWKSPSDEVIASVQQMDSILDEFIYKEESLSIRELIGLINRHWEYSRNWYPSDLVKRLETMVVSFKPMTVSAAFVGAGPAAIFTSDQPAHMLSKMLEKYTDIKYRHFIPVFQGVKVIHELLRGT